MAIPGRPEWCREAPNPAERTAAECRDEEPPAACRGDVTRRAIFTPARKVHSASVRGVVSSIGNGTAGSTLNSTANRCDPARSRLAQGNPSLMVSLAVQRCGRMRGAKQD